MYLPCSPFKSTRRYSVHAFSIVRPQTNTRMIEKDLILFKDSETFWKYSVMVYSTKNFVEATDESSKTNYSFIFFHDLCKMKVICIIFHDLSYYHLNNHVSFVFEKLSGVAVSWISSWIFKRRWIVTAYRGVLGV